MAILPLTLSLFKTPYKPVDIVLASVAGATVSLIPNVGSIVSYFAMLGALNWRLHAQLTDILVPVAIARLSAIPVLLLVRMHSG
jgi:hypothetical protein